MESLKFTVREKTNTGRQIEFDIAKCICILGMVFVHCFEELAFADATESSMAYYIMVVVLDCLFGASTFMSSMGLGIAYNRKTNADKIIKRGLVIFMLAYLLNLTRGAIPVWIARLINHKAELMDIGWQSLLYIDIMHFAGLALILFGLLKKMKLSNGRILMIALIMSVMGSFIREFDMGSLGLNQSVGLFFGTTYHEYGETMTAFPLFNWFIFVAGGNIYGEFLMRVKDKKRYYRWALPASLSVILVYMAIAIPGRFGMMSGDLNLFYHMTTLDAAICFAGMIFATSMYYFLSLICSEKLKKLMTRISTNINRTYCVHWLMIGWMKTVFLVIGYDGLRGGQVFLVGILIFVAANVIAEMRTRQLEKKAGSEEPACYT